MFQHFPRNPTFLLKLERVFYILYETPEVPQHTHAFLSGTPSFLAQLNLSPFPLLYRDEVYSPASSGKECQSTLVAPQEETGLNLKLERSPGSCHNLKDTDFPIHLR